MELHHRITLVRHGETEWSRERRHTGRTDLPLTGHGREQARLAGGRLRGRDYALVLVSPLTRARQTAELAGFARLAEPDGDLVEVDYGPTCEGRTADEIREDRPGWEIWRDGTPDGEPFEAVGERADRVIARLLDAPGDSLVFAHGHVIRVLAARWIGLAAQGGGHFPLATAAICMLGFEREKRGILRWNDAVHLEPDAS